MLTAQRDGSVPGASHSVVRQANGLKRVSPAGTGQGGRIPPSMGRSGRLRRSLCIRRKPFALDSGRFTSRYFKKLLKSREQVSKMHSDRFDSPKNGIFTYDRPPRGTPPGSLLLQRITRAGRQHVKGPGPPAALTGFTHGTRLSLRHSLRRLPRRIPGPGNLRG